jgi:predicted nucleic-acid-binding protein
MGGRAMRIAVDTNVLIRGVVRDDPAQAEAADKVLKGASIIAVALPCLCEFVWVLRRVYGFSVEDIASALEALVNTGNVVLNRPAVEVGLAFLRAGGDFADGAIAYEGKWMGGDTFVSFDRKAVALLTAQGYSAQLLI